MQTDAPSTSLFPSPPSLHVQIFVCMRMFVCVWVHVLAYMSLFVHAYLFMYVRVVFADLFFVEYMACVVATICVC